MKRKISKKTLAVVVLILIGMILVYFGIGTMEVEGPYPWYGLPQGLVLAVVGILMMFLGALIAITRKVD